VPAGHVPSGIERQQVASVWRNRLRAHLRAEDNGGLKFTGVDVAELAQGQEISSVVRNSVPQFFTVPRTVVDREGNILVWYLPGFLNQNQQVFSSHIAIDLLIDFV